MKHNFAVGTLAKISHTAFMPNKVFNEPDTTHLYYGCISEHTGNVTISRKALQNQLVEIVNVLTHDECYKAWIPAFKVYIICFDFRFEPL